MAAGTTTAIAHAAATRARRAPVMDEEYDTSPRLATIGTCRAQLVDGVIGRATWAEVEWAFAGDRVLPPVCWRGVLPARRKTAQYDDRPWRPWNGGRDREL